MRHANSFQRNTYTSRIAELEQIFPSYDDDENLIIKFIKDSSPSPEDVLISEELEEKLLSKIKDKLTDLEESVFTLMINGFKYKEIAEILDKDEKSIDNTIQRLKSKIRKVINK